MHSDKQEVTATISSTALGFGSGIPDAPVPEPQPGIIDAAQLPPLNEDADADMLAEVIRQKSLVRVNALSDLLAERAGDPTASSKLLLDTIEQNIKLSGITAKQQAKEAGAGTGYQLVINIGTNRETYGGVTVEQVPESSGA